MYGNIWISNLDSSFFVLYLIYREQKMNSRGYRMTVQKHRTGRIEAVRYADEVLKRRSSGESLAWIYSDLAERKDVAVSYSAFTRWVKKLELGKLQVTGQTRQSRNCADPDSSSTCLLYTSPSPRDRQKSRMPSSA